MARYILHSHWYLDRSSKERVKSFIPHTHTHTHTHTPTNSFHFMHLYIYMLCQSCRRYLFSTSDCSIQTKDTTLHSIQNSKLWQSIPIQCYTPIFIWIELELLRGEWSEVKQFQISKWICNFVWFVTAPRPLFIYVIPLEQTNEWRVEVEVWRRAASTVQYSTLKSRSRRESNPIQSNPWVYIYIYIHCNLFILLDFDFDFDHDDEPIVRFCVVRFFLYTTWF